MWKGALKVCAVFGGECVCGEGAVEILLVGSIDLCVGCNGGGGAIEV